MVSLSSVSSSRVSPIFGGCDVVIDQIGASPVTIIVLKISPSIDIHLMSFSVSLKMSFWKDFTTFEISSDKDS